MKHLASIAAVLALGCAAPALAQSAKSAAAPAGFAPMQNPCVVQSDGTCLAVSVTNPLPVTGGTGGGGGGGGDASAVNQTRTQATAGSNSAYATGVQGVDGGKAIGVTAATLPLPAGAATQATLATVDSRLADTYASGSIALGTASATFTVAIGNGAGTAGVMVAGLTGSGATLTPEASYDGVNWVAITGITAGTGAASVSALTTDGQYRFNASARRSLRLRVTTAGSGAATVVATASAAGWDPLTPALDANRDLRVPTVTVSPFFVSLAANTSVELLAASTSRIGYELQCTGTAAVAISRTHAALTSATPSAGGADWIIPQGTSPAYIPAYVSGAGVTAYTGTAQACWGVSYARQ